MKTKPTSMPKTEVVAPATWDPADAVALQALSQGTAEKHQQIRALQFIINAVCGTYDMSYRSEKALDTVFAEGKRSVGLQIVKLVNMPREVIAVIAAKQTQTRKNQ